MHLGNRAQGDYFGWTNGEVGDILGAPWRVYVITTATRAG